MDFHHNNSSTLYFSASCTMRSISSLLSRPLSLVIVILLFLPAARLGSYMAITCQGAAASCAVVHHQCCLRFAAIDQGGTEAHRAVTAATGYYVAPDVLSSAETLRMPFASMSKPTWTFMHTRTLQLRHSCMAADVDALTFHLHGHA